MCITSSTRNPFQSDRTSFLLPLMGIPSDLRDAWATSRRMSPPVVSVSSPLEAHVQEAVVSGFKNAAIAGLVASGPVIVGCRTIPWAKANLNHTAQALLISAASIAAFFITADKTILERAKKNSFSKNSRSS